EGQLLAGGILDSNVVGARGVHSQGNVMADVFIKKSGDYSLTAQEEVPTGKKNKSYTVCFGKKEVKIPARAKNFELKKTDSEKIPLKVGDIYFPVSLIKNTEVEIITKPVKLDREKVIAEAEKYLDELLQKEVGSGTIRERYFFYEDIDENTVRVRLEALCNMQIAQKQPI
ncbi:MAG: sporulation protein YqfD, partial [Monoglobales bacterium]